MPAKSLQRIHRSISRRGVAATLKLAAGVCAVFARRSLRFWAELSFDLRNGVETRGTVHHRVGEERDDPFGHAVSYQGVWTSTFRRAMRCSALSPHERYVFIDLGCGKGKAVLLASEQRFRRVIGVELSPALADVACRNLVRYSRRHPHLCPAEVVCGNAAEIEFPPEPLAIYLHNPFDDVILSRVVERLGQSLLEQVRPTLVIYHAPVHREVLDRADFLVQCAVVPGGIVYGTVPRAAPAADSS